MGMLHKAQVLPGGFEGARKSELYLDSQKDRLNKEIRDTKAAIYDNLRDLLRLKPTVVFQEAFDMQLQFRRSSSPYENEPRAPLFACSLEGADKYVFNDLFHCCCLTLFKLSFVTVDHV